MSCKQVLYINMEDVKRGSLMSGIGAYDRNEFFVRGQMGLYWPRGAGPWGSLLGGHA